MPTFRYETIDAEGRPVEGRIEAAHAGEALRLLGKQGFDARQTTVVAEDAPPDKPPVAGGRLSAPEALEVAEEVAQLAQADLPLGPGLRTLADEWGGRSGGVLHDLANRLDRGATLDEAIAEQKDRFPAPVGELIRAGVQSGRLASVLGQLTEIEHQRADQRRRTWQVVAYPVFLLGIWLLTVLLLLISIVPQFENIFLDFDTRLPLMTEALLWLSHGALFVPAVVIVLAVAAWLFWTLPGWGELEKLRWLVPLLGPMRRCGALARLTSLLGLLVEQKAPLPEAVRLAGVGAGNPALAVACRQVADRLSEGQSLAESLTFQAEFPQAIVPMIDWAERHGALDETLDTISRMFENRARVQSDLTAVIALPLTLLLFLVTIPFFVIGLFLPLIKLVECLS